MRTSASMQSAPSAVGMFSSIQFSARQSRSAKELGQTGRGFSKWRSVHTVLLLCLATAIAMPAQTFTSLASFNGTNGHAPNYASLVQGLDGNLYGTTAEGTKYRCSNSLGCGTTFKITPNGALTTLYAFCSQTNCADGDYPLAGLVLATDGSFYGVTYEGGAHTNSTICPVGCGTVFKITPTGTLTTLASFCAQTNCTDGASPLGTLVQATDGDFYGTTASGGKNTNCSNSYSHGCGTVFKITPNGTLTTLYSFCSQTGCPDGTEPTVLLAATNGNFYGLTAGGGVSSVCGNFGGCGTVFKITPSGTLTTLYSFCSQSNCTDGVNPQELIQAASGKFYGTTAAGGNSNNGGTVFTMTTSGALTTLYTFCAQGLKVYCPDGAQPNALVQATDGNFYGATYGGGGHGSCGDVYGCGVVFKVTSGGTLTTLYSFCAQTNCADGSTAGSLVQATDGNFYGTTNKGGADHDGTVFSLSTGLSPFVKALPTSGKVGATVTILGTNLTGATSVKFNGTAATFTMVSSSEITTTVPTGATTGKIKVTTLSRTLNSNVSFRVVQ